MDRHTRHFENSVGSALFNAHANMTARERRGIAWAVILFGALALVVVGFLNVIIAHVAPPDRLRQMMGGSGWIGLIFLLAPWVTLNVILLRRWLCKTGSGRALAAGVVVSLAAIGMAQVYNGVLSEAAYLIANPSKDRALALACPGWLARSPSLGAEGELSAYRCNEYLEPKQHASSCARILDPLTRLSGNEAYLCSQLANRHLPDGAFWPVTGARSYVFASEEASPAQMAAAVKSIRQIAVQ